MLRKITIDEFESIYHIMEESFPTDERRNYDGQKSLFQKDSYKIYVLEDEDTGCVKGFLAVYNLDEVLFVEHFAVNPEFRNQGLGSVMLQELKNMTGKMLCLEVEHPTTKLAKRRIGFYERNGFYLNDYPYIQPALGKDRSPVPLKIMTTGRGMEEMEFERIRDMIYREAYDILCTKRLFLRPWTKNDAESLYEYAKNPDVGYPAGWPAHKDIAESCDVIEHVLNGKECYAVCRKEDYRAIGAVELKLNGHTDMTDRDDECELGYWIGKPFWGMGYIPEAVKELIRHGFEELQMRTIWCGYYDGNEKSKRVQEKCGFTYYRTTEGLEVPLLNEVRTGHTNIMTKEQWEKPNDI